MWLVEFTDEFGQWFQGLSHDDQDAVARGVGLLESLGPALGRPWVDTLKASKHTHLKELRTQSNGRPIRTFFAFDPRRAAILLIGGDKTGDDRFYEKFIPMADNLYDQHIQQLKKEGLIP